MLRALLIRAIRVFVVSISPRISLITRMLRVLLIRVIREIRVEYFTTNQGLMLSVEC